MPDVLVAENYVDAQCIRHVHLVGLDEEKLRAHPYAVGGELVKESSSWHYRAEYLYSGLVDIHREGWPKPKRLVIWPLKNGDRMSGITKAAAAEFRRVEGAWPSIAYVKRLPTAIESGTPIQLEEKGTEILLFQAEWMLSRAVAVGVKDLG